MNEKLANYGTPLPSVQKGVAGVCIIDYQTYFTVLIVIARWDDIEKPYLAAIN